MREETALRRTADGLCERVTLHFGKSGRVYLDLADAERDDPHLALDLAPTSETTRVIGWGELDGEHVVYQLDDGTEILRGPR